MKLFRTFTILITLSILLILLSGCTDQDWRDFFGIGKTWAEEHNVLDKNGKPNSGAITSEVLGKGVKGGPEADTVLDASNTVKNFDEAEKLSKQGQVNHDVAKIDEAISKRPKEFRYHNQRGAILLFDGDDTQADKDFAQADSLAKDYNKLTRIRNLQSRIDSLVAEKDRYALKNKSSSIEYRKAEIRYYKYLSDTHNQLYLVSGNPDQKDAAEYAKSEFERLMKEMNGEK